MKQLISKLSFTDRLTLTFIAIMVVTFILSPNAGAMLLGTTIGLCLDPFIFLPALMIGYLFNGSKKEKIIALGLATVIASISALFIAKHFNDYIVLVSLKLYALTFFIVLSKLCNKTL